MVVHGCDHYSYPEHVTDAALRARLEPVYAKDCPNGHSTIDIGRAIQWVHDYAVLASVGLLNDHWVIIFLADLQKRQGSVGRTHQENAVKLKLKLREASL